MELHPGADGVGVAAELVIDGESDLVQSNTNGAQNTLRNDRRATHYGIRIPCLRLSGEFPPVGAQLRVPAGGRTQVGESGPSSGSLRQSNCRPQTGPAAASGVYSLNVRHPNGVASHPVGPALHREIDMQDPVRSAWAALLP